MKGDHILRALDKFIDEQPCISEEGELWVDHNGIPMVAYVAVAILARDAVRKAIPLLAEDR